jgi:hypothetical protein
MSAAEESNESSIMTPEEEEAWLGKYFSGKPVVEDEQDQTTIEQQMDSLEKEFEETMKMSLKTCTAVTGTMHEATLGAATPSTSAAAVATTPSTSVAAVAAAATLGAATPSTSAAAVATTDTMHEATLSAATPSTSAAAAAAAPVLLKTQPKESGDKSDEADAVQQCAIRKVYGELHAQADADIVMKLRLAMEGIPEGAKGLDDCITYFASKQHYTLQDILVAQYVLNDGLLMRQGHGTSDEYHVDIAEPLV